MAISEGQAGVGGPEWPCHKENGKGYWIDVNLCIFLQAHDKRLCVSSCSVQQCKYTDSEKYIDAYYTNLEIKNLEGIINTLEKKQESKITSEGQNVKVNITKKRKMSKSKVVCLSTEIKLYHSRTEDIWFSQL